MEALIGFGLMMAWTIIAIRHGWAGLWWLSFAGLLAVGGAVTAALCVAGLAFYLLVRESATREETS